MRCDTTHKCENHNSIRRHCGSGSLLLWLNFCHRISLQSITAPDECGVLNQRHSDSLLHYSQAKNRNSPARTVWTNESRNAQMPNCSAETSQLILGHKALSMPFTRKVKARSENGCRRQITANHGL